MLGNADRQLDTLSEANPPAPKTRAAATSGERRLPTTTTITTTTTLTLTTATMLRGTAGANFSGRNLHSERTVAQNLFP